VIGRKLRFGIVYLKFTATLTMIGVALKFPLGLNFLP
jgi:hypothetical protein